MPLPSSLADIAQKSVVLFLTGTTIYYMVNVGVLVNRRMELKKQGKLEEELARLTGTFMKNENGDIHAETLTTPCPMPATEQPGKVNDA